MKTITGRRRRRGAVGPRHAGRSGQARAERLYKSRLRRRFFSAGIPQQVKSIPGFWEWLAGAAMLLAVASWSALAVLLAS
jgi:hypothetical protein